MSAQQRQSLAQRPTQLLEITHEIVEHELLSLHLVVIVVILELTLLQVSKKRKKLLVTKHLCTHTA